MTGRDKNAVEIGSLDEVSRLLGVLINLKFETQTEAILALHDVGLSNARIGQLLGTTTATARARVNENR
jgi:hypothetical protein